MFFSFFSSSLSSQLQGLRLPIPLYFYLEGKLLLAGCLLQIEQGSSRATSLFNCFFAKPFLQIVKYLCTYNVLLLSTTFSQCSKQLLFHCIFSEDLFWEGNFRPADCLLGRIVGYNWMRRHQSNFIFLLKVRNQEQRAESWECRLLKNIAKCSLWFCCCFCFFACIPLFVFCGCVFTSVFVRLDLCLCWC